LVLSELQYRYIVRIAGVDVPGELRVVDGLSLVKGVGYNFALALCRLVGIDPYKRVGFLSDGEVERLESALSNPISIGVPVWMLNRRKDIESGRDLHLIGADLIYYVKRDIDREKRIRSWRGIRHALGLKVRGQRTATTGRVGMTVGVKRRR